MTEISNKLNLNGAKTEFKTFPETRSRTQKLFLSYSSLNSLRISEKEGSSLNNCSNNQCQSVCLHY